MVGHQSHRLTGLHQMPDGLYVLKTRLQVESAGGFVQDQSFRIVNQRSPQEKAPLLTRRHGRIGFLLQCADPERVQDFSRARRIVVTKAVVPGNIYARIEAR